MHLCIYRPRNSLRILDYWSLYLQVDGAKSADAVFKDVKAIFTQLNTQVHIHVPSSNCLVQEKYHD